jgi:uncharacterized membrane protein YfcA
MSVEWMYLGFALVAFLYAGVGHGGGSGYLAVMALCSYHAYLARPDALLLNLVVSGTAFMQFYRGGYFKLRDFLWLAGFSVPMAFLGGLVPIQDELYKKLLGVMLLSASAMMVFRPAEPNNVKQLPVLAAAVIGAVIGFVSGLTGIGGGVWLSPILLLAGWARQKETAALSSAFIFVNSLSGLLGWIRTDKPWDENLPVMIGIVLISGGLGAWLGAVKYRSAAMKWLLALVLGIAAVKLLVV